MAIPSAALTRLSAGFPQGYNNGAFNLSTNPYGFDNSGYINNLFNLTADVTEVGEWLAEQVGPVVDLSDDISALAAITGNITTLANIAANVTTLAALSSALTTLAAISANITTAATNAASITAVAGNATNINAVAAAVVNINSVAGALTNISTVVGMAANIAAVAANSTNINTVATANSNINTVASNIGNVNSVASNAANINAVAADASDIGIVAGAASAIGSVSSNITAVQTASTSIAAIIAAANNIALIQAAPTNATNAQNAADAAQGFADVAQRLTLFSVYDNGTTDADPGNGKFRLNNSSITSVTFLYIDDLEALGGDITQWVATWDDSSNPTTRGELTFVNAANRAIWFKLKVTGAVIAGTGYRKVPVAFIDNAGTLVNGASFGMAFSPAGDKGSDGLGAGDVIGPAGAVDSHIAVFDTNTGKLLKGGGVAVSGLATSAQGALAATALQPGTLGTEINNLAAKTAPVDTDLVGLVDSAASNVLKKFSWANLKAALATYFGTIYAAISHSHTVSQLSDATPNGRSWLQAANYAAMKTLLALVKADVGLGNVDNTSDLSKPISTATQSALDAKSAVGHTHAWNDISSGKPTTLAGYGITDAATSAQGVKADSALQAAAIGSTLQPYDVDTAKTDVAQNFTAPQRTAPVSLSSATTLSFTLAGGNSRTLTLGHNATLPNPSDIASYIGMKGSIACQQNGTGTFTLSFGNLWFPIGSATAPSAPTGANVKFRIDYEVVSSTRIDFSLNKVGVA
jgi:hypothetical protein